MLTAPLFSRIIVRDAGGKYPRAILRVRFGDRARAQRWLRGVRARLRKPVGHVDAGRVSFEGAAAVRVAEWLGWPEEVVRPMRAMAETSRGPGVALEAHDITMRQHCAELLVEAVGEATAAAERATL